MVPSFQIVFFFFSLAEFLQCNRSREKSQGLLSNLCIPSSFLLQWTMLKGLPSPPHATLEDLPPQLASFLPPSPLCLSYPNSAHQEHFGVFVLRKQLGHWSCSSFWDKSRSAYGSRANEMRDWRGFSEAHSPRSHAYHVASLWWCLCLREPVMQLQVLVFKSPPRQTQWRFPCLVLTAVLSEDCRTHKHREFIGSPDFSRDLVLSRTMKVFCTTQLYLGQMTFSSCPW